MAFDKNKKYIEGELPKSRFSEQIQSSNGIKTKDSAVSPVSSPVAVTTASVQNLTTPNDAIEITLAPTQDLRVSEDPAMASYDIVKANTKEVLGVSGMPILYVKMDSANGTVAFSYVTI